MNRFPWLSLTRALMALRITVAVLFLAHATVRIVLGTIPRFALFLDHAGMPLALAVVWLITGFELAGGTLLLAGRCVRAMSAGFCILLVAGIILIHGRLGWFVGEHGTGGSEYSVALLAALVVIAAGDDRGAAALQEGRA